MTTACHHPQGPAEDHAIHHRRWAPYVAGGRWWLFATRPRRVVFALGLIWILNVFDVVFTLLAFRIGEFREGNPLAREFVYAGESLIAYKVMTVGLASLLLILLWRRKLTEIACWAGFGGYLLLSVLWAAYFSLLV
jgi:hypothetical protein